MIAYINILISGIILNEHDSNLHVELKRLQNVALLLNRDKCEFQKSLISYLNHRTDSEGIHQTQDKVNAIWKTPISKNVLEHKSYRAFINYYHQYSNNICTLLVPLYTLLQKGVSWKQSLCI